MPQLTLCAAALLAALERRGVPAHGRSGLHVWVPVCEEGFAVRHLLEAGYAVVAGERFRLRAGPAVRVTTAQLLPAGAEPPADALAEAASGRSLITWARSPSRRPRRRCRTRRARADAAGPGGSP